MAETKDNEGLDNLHKTEQHQEINNADSVILKKVVSDSGLDVDKITLGDEVKSFDDLTDQQKYNITKGIIEKKQESSTPQLSKDELDAVRLVKEAQMPINDIVDKEIGEKMQEREIAGGVNVEFFKGLEDEDAYMLYLKQKHPDKDEQEIAELFNKAKDLDSFEEDSKKAKEVLIEKQELLQEKAKDDLRKKWTEQIEGEREYIVNDVLEKVPNIGILKMFKEDYNNTFEDILEVDDEGNTPFIKDINSTPENLFKAAWLYKNGEKEISNIKNYYEGEILKLKEELKKANAGIEYIPEDKKVEKDPGNKGITTKDKDTKGSVDNLFSSK